MGVEFLKYVTCAKTANDTYLSMKTKCDEQCAGGVKEAQAQLNIDAQQFILQSADAQIHVVTKFCTCVKFNFSCENHNLQLDQMRNAVRAAGLQTGVR
jgi:hypothetical protein